VSQFGGVDETLPFSVVRLESFHEVGERTGVRLATDGLVDRQNLLEPILLFACIASSVIRGFHTPLSALED